MSQQQTSPGPAPDQNDSDWDRLASSPPQSNESCRKRCNEDQEHSGAKRIKENAASKERGPVGLVDLPDDCILWHIFNHLPVYEIVRSRAICMRFRPLVEKVEVTINPTHLFCLTTFSYGSR